MERIHMHTMRQDTHRKPMEAPQPMPTGTKRWKARIRLLHKKYGCNCWACTPLNKPWLHAPRTTREAKAAKRDNP